MVVRQSGVTVLDLEMVQKKYLTPKCRPYGMHKINVAVTDWISIVIVHH